MVASLDLLPHPPLWFQSPGLHTISQPKPVSSLPDTHLGWPFRCPFYPLERDSEKSSNSLQELADEQRLRKLSTRGGAGVSLAAAPSLARSLQQLPEAVTRGAAVSGAVSCVPSASHGGRGPGLARP